MGELKYYKKISREYNLLKDIQEITTLKVQVDDIGVKYIAEICPLCGSTERHFILYDASYEERGQYTWESDCVEQKKDLDSIAFYQYRKNTTWKGGLNSLKNKLIEEKELEIQKGQIDFERNDRGTILRTYENLKILIDSEDIELKYNQLTKRIEITSSKFNSSEFDIASTKINTYCQRVGLSLGKQLRNEFIECIANDNKFNPITEYLTICKSKREVVKGEKSYINELLSTLKYARKYTKEDIEFNNLVLIKFLLSCIKLAYNEGLSNLEFVPIFKAKQGIGKTRWVKKIIPQDKINEWFAEGKILDLTNKDSIMEVTNKWIVELGEINGTMKKSDRDRLKAFLTSSSDEFRSPYSTKSTKYPRHTAFIGTVNDDEFLRDDTGNRRFVVIELEQVDYMHSIDIDLVWGELMLMYEQVQVETYLTSEEQAYNEKRNRDYMVKSDEQMLLEEYLPLDQPKENWGYITSTAICDYMQEVHCKILKPRAVGKALASMGYEQEYTRIKDKKGRYYKLPYLDNYSMPF